MDRDRLNKSPVSKLLTLTEDMGYYDCENFILNTACQKYDVFSNWIAHLDYVRIIFADYKDIYLAGEDFDKIHQIVIKRLKLSGFETPALQSLPHESCANVSDFAFFCFLEILHLIKVSRPFIISYNFSRLF